MTQRKPSKLPADPAVNKSQAIRDYRQAHPNHKPAKIAEALDKRGIHVSAQFVSTILSNSKKKRTIRKPGRPKGSTGAQIVGSSLPGSGAEISLDALLKVKQIVIQLGGVSQAKAALDALEQLLD